MTAVGAVPDIDAGRFHGQPVSDSAHRTQSRRNGCHRKLAIAGNNPVISLQSGFRFMDRSISRCHLLAALATTLPLLGRTSAQAVTAPPATDATPSAAGAPVVEEVPYVQTPPRGAPHVAARRPESARHRLGPRLQAMAASSLPPRSSLLPMPPDLRSTWR